MTTPTLGVQKRCESHFACKCRGESILVVFHVDVITVLSRVTRRLWLWTWVNSGDSRAYKRLDKRRGQGFWASLCTTHTSASGCLPSEVSSVRPCSAYLVHLGKVLCGKLGLQVLCTPGHSCCAITESIGMDGPLCTRWDKPTYPSVSSFTRSDP